MYLIPPIPVTNAVLLASNVAEADYPAWAISNAHKSVDAQAGSVGATIHSKMSADGTRLYLVNTSSGNVYQFTLSIPGDIFSLIYLNSFDASAQTGAGIYGIDLSADGTQMYLAATSNTYQYALATAWDSHSASYSSKSYSNPTFVVWDIRLSADGFQLLTLASNYVIYTTSLLTSCDISTAIFSFAVTSVSNGSPCVVTKTAHGLHDKTAFTFSTTGTLPAGLTTGVPYYVKYIDANTFNVSATRGGAAINTSTAGSGTHTALNTTPSVAMTAQEATPKGFTLSSDETKLYVIGTTAKTVFEYSLTTTSDITSRSYISKSLDVSARDTAPTFLFFNTLGTILTTGGITSRAVYQYTLTTGFDLPTGTNQINAYNTGDRTMVVSPSGTFTVAVANPAVFTQVAHGLADDTPVMLTTTGALLTGLVAGTLYYIRDRTDDTYTLALKPGGTPIATSGTQSGVHTCTAQVHQIFESKQDANESHYPLISPDWWMLVGWTNKWKMFDQSGMSQTANADSIVKTFNVIGVNPSVGLFNLYGTTARITMSNMAAAFTATISNASPAVVTKTAHGLTNGQAITLTTTGVLPTGLLPNVVYYVFNATANTFNLVSSLNLLTYSDQFDNGAAWHPGAQVTTNSTTAPDGTLTADTFTAAGFGIFQACTWTNGLPYTYSIYAKSSGSSSFNIRMNAIDVGGTGDIVCTANTSTGAISKSSGTGTPTLTSESLGNGWWRFNMTFAATGSVAGYVSVETAPSGIFIWRAWLEVGSIATKGSSTQATSGATAINTSSAGSGTHTVAPAVFNSFYWLNPNGVRVTDLVELGMPLYTSSIITVTLTATGETVLCGTMGIGQQFYVGGTQFGAKVGIKDFSLKSTDQFGTTTFKEGDYAKRGTFMVEVDNTLVDQLIDNLSAYRAKPMIYVCTTLFRSTLIYGKYNDFEVEIAYTNTSILSTQVESLV